jgi:hypothetical protein
MASPNTKHTSHWLQHKSCHCVPDAGGRDDATAGGCAPCARLHLSFQARADVMRRGICFAAGMPDAKEVVAAASSGTMIIWATQLKSAAVGAYSNRAAALSREGLPATMRCIISMNSACSRSLRSPSVARCARRAAPSILTSRAAPAGVRRHNRARRSSLLTARSTRFRAASRFNAPVVVVRSRAISAAKLV